MAGKNLLEIFYKYHPEASDAAWLRQATDIALRADKENRMIEVRASFPEPIRKAVDPSIYGEEKHPNCGGIESSRDVFELSLLSKVTALDKPVFGICRGIQVMNVALGGTLWQDIPSQWSEPHGTVHFERNENNDPRHRVTVSGMLREVLGEEVVTTNSYHHQSVKKVGDGLVVCAVNEDGIVEGIEHTELTFYRAVQWHPEVDPDDVSKKLFTEFLRHVQA